MEEEREPAGLIVRPKPFLPDEEGNYPSVQCTAHAKSKNGDRCQRQARYGYTVCSMHGAGQGDRHPGDANIKHGRYSRFMKTSLAEMIEAHEQNAEASDMTSELATLRALMQGVLEHIEEQDDPISLAALINTITKCVDSAGLAITRMEKLKSGQSITYPEAIRLVNQMTEVLRQVVTDKAQVEEVIKGWRMIRVQKTGRKN